MSPSVGRKVWYRPEGAEGKTLDATVCAVNENSTINVAVHDEYGEHLGGFRNVVLVDEGGVAPGTGPYCEWMPFQIAAAKAATEAAPPLAAAQVAGDVTQPTGDVAKDAAAGAAGAGAGGTGGMGGPTGS